MAPVGQLSQPQPDAQGELAIDLSGVPGEPFEPDEPDDEPSGGYDAGAEEETVVHDLADWPDDARTTVGDRLHDVGVAYWWVDGELHVAETDAGLVADVLDEVAGLVRGLDPDRDQIAYDLAEWDDDRVAALEAALDDAEIPFGWDSDELFVHADDEEAVDDLVDRVTHPHELPAEDDDDTGGGEVLGELFVVADRLQHDPAHREAVGTLAELDAQLADLAAPYGLARTEWDRLRELAGELATLLRSGQVDEDAVADAARGLRAALRPYV